MRKRRKSDSLVLCQIGAQNVIITKSQDATRTKSNWNELRRENSRLISELVFLLVVTSFTILNANSAPIKAPEMIGGHKAVATQLLRQNHSTVARLDTFSSNSSTTKSIISKDDDDDDEDDDNNDGDADAEGGKASFKGAARFESFLKTLPILSVGQKHKAIFECELDEVHATSRLVWVRLDPTQQAANNSRPTFAAIKPISLDQKIISPDRRFKVHRQSPLKWLLSIDNVTPEDHRAYFLCQPSASEATQAHRASDGFVNGGQLLVLAPPKMVEEETSASLVLASEYEPLTLRCKVTGEPRSELSWKREDGRAIEGAQLRFKHQLNRHSHPNQLVSIDSSELHFSSLERHQAGAYLCIASNGVQPGVSQRINVRAINCRKQVELNSPSEACDEPATSTMQPEGPATSDSPPARVASGRQTAGGEQRNSTNWRLASGGARRNSQQQQQQLQHMRGSSDKRRNGGRIAESNYFRELASSSSSATSALISSSVLLHFGLIDGAQIIRLLLLPLLLVGLCQRIV